MSATATNPVRPLPQSQVSDWHREADVVIVGFGGAGGCAAIEAATAGADTLVLEVASGGGGSTALSSSEIYLGGDGGTPAQRANGFEDSNENMFKYLMMAGGPNADEAKVRLYVDNNLDHYRWLTETLGMEFNDTFVAERTIIHMTDDCLLFTGSEEAYPFNTESKPCPRGHKPKVTGDNGGAYLTEKIQTKADSLSNLKVEYNTRALRVIQDDNGRVVGVMARIDMEERCIRARRGLILCAGGFAMNHEMLRRYAPALLRNGRNHAIGNPYDDGSGIRIGMGAGGAAINMGEGFVSLPFYPPADFLKGVLINAQGQRFINEDCYHGRTGHFCLRQRDDAIYLVLDNELHQKPNEYLNMDLAGSGETIEELERELKLPEGSLQNTLQIYNREAANGRDPLFGKGKKYLKPLDKGPWAAFDCSIGKVYYPYFTLGGLETLPSGEVLDTSGEVIPGLYAAGRNSCGLPRTGAGYSSGMSIGDATFFGRQAGRSAASA